MPTIETQFSGNENRRAKHLEVQFGLSGAVSGISSNLTRLEAT